MPEQVPLVNIDVFSVMTKSENPKKTDVRFSVHGSPFYKPVKLNGIMLRHREDFESELNINITMVGIDECLYENENCEGSCTNNLENYIGAVKQILRLHTWARKWARTQAKSVKIVESMKHTYADEYFEGTS